MKFSHIALTMATCTILFTACKKKDDMQTSITPMAPRQPPTPAIVPPTAINYPYTDTFRGALTIILNDYQGFPMSSGKDTAYEFYVTHINEKLIFVTGGKGIDLKTGSNVYITNDTLTSAGNNLYSGDMYLFKYKDESPVLKNALNYQLTANALMINWDVDVPFVGSCVDYGESIGSYGGYRK